MRFAAMASFVLLLGSSTFAQTAKPTELKALEHFVGTWDTEFTARSPDKEFRGKGAETMEWVLDGRFVQGKGQDVGGQSSIMLFGWDADAKAYTAWHFSSQGRSSKVLGQWNEADKTFTWKGDHGNGVTSTGFTRFHDADNREFKMTTKDAAGKVVFEIEAKLKRRK